MKNEKGLIVNVLRPADFPDCTNCGPSFQKSRFVVVDPEIEGVFTPNDHAPEMKLVRRNIMGNDYIHAVPTSLADYVEKYGGHIMFGGNFIYSSDSRLRKICQYPIPIHDRFEPVLEY